MSASSGPSAPPRPVPPADAGPGELVRWVFTVLNAHDPEALRQVLAPDTHDRLPTRTLRGADEVVGYYRDLLAALPDAVFTLVGLAERDGEVFTRWRLTGSHSGAPFEGFEPTGRRLDVDGVDHVTVADGRVTSSFVVLDQVQVARQLGLLPTAGSRPDVGLRTAFNVLARRRRR